MAHQFSALTFTGDVKAVQRELGSRPANAKLTERAPSNDAFSEFEKSFIAARDGFYISTVGSAGWPYIQFRGGPSGFLRVLNDRALAYADVTGNRQYITTGNLRSDDRAALFLMDYPNQARLKILGHVEVIPWKDAPGWKDQLLLPTDAKPLPERVVIIHLAAFDWNCPQHIPQRWTLEEFKQTPFFDRIKSLEAEVNDLRTELAVSRSSG